MLWQWVVVVDEAQRRAVGDIYRDITLAYLQSAPSASLQYADNPKRSAIQQRIGASSEVFGARHGRSAGARSRVHRDRAVQRRQPSPAAGLIAARSMELRARRARPRDRHGPGMTMHLQREAEVAEILGIPNGYRQGVLMPTAYYTGERSGLPCVIPSTRYCTLTVGNG